MALKVKDSSSGYDPLSEFLDGEVRDTNPQESGEKEEEETEELIPSEFLLLFEAFGRADWECDWEYEDRHELCAGREREAEELPELGTEKVIPKRVVREWAEYVREKIEYNVEFIEFATTMIGESVTLTPEYLERKYGLTPEDVDEVFGDGYTAELCKVYKPRDGTGDLPQIIPKVPVARKPIARRKTVDMGVWQRRIKILAKEAERKRQEAEQEAERRREKEEKKRRLREAEEFVRMFPDVWFKNIPKEVLERRAQGGVTLAEAYKLYVGNGVSSLPKAKMEEREVSLQELSENVAIMSEYCRLHGFSLRPGSGYAEICLDATKEQLLAMLIEALETKSRERPKHR